MTSGNVKAVCSWIGNSPAVAMQHYAQVTEADLQKAAKMTILNTAEKEAHDPVQNPVESSSIELREVSEPIDVTTCICGAKQANAGGCENVQYPQNWAIQDLNL